MSSEIHQVEKNKENGETRSEDVLQGFQPLIQTVGENKCKLGRELPWEEMPLFFLESPPSLGDLPQFN